MEPHRYMQSYEVNASVTVSCQCHVRCVRLFNDALIPRLYGDGWEGMVKRKDFETINRSKIDSCICPWAENITENPASVSRDKAECRDEDVPNTRLEPCLYA